MYTDFLIFDSILFYYYFKNLFIVDWAGSSLLGGLFSSRAGL